jgi:hypothetical protein
MGIRLGIHSRGAKALFQTRCYKPAEFQTLWSRELRANAGLLQRVWKRALAPREDSHRSLKPPTPRTVNLRFAPLESHPLDWFETAHLPVPMKFRSRDCSPPYSQR